MRQLEALKSAHYDVIVVGGGIAGAFAAWDATLRGLKVALFEKGDFCSATSAHSLKFVHGGIRYLQHLDLARLRESRRERSAFLRIAPHCVSLIPVVVPCYGRGLGSTAAFRSAFLAVKALSVGLDRGLPDPENQIRSSRILSKQETLERYPHLASDGLTGAALFYDGHIHNPTRLTYSVLESARQGGAVTANYTEVQDITVSEGRARGVAVRDLVSGEEAAIRAKVVLNCAGPFAEQLLVRAGLAKSRKVPLSRDLALVIKRNLTGDAALAIQTRFCDPDALLSRGNRHLFLVPWRGYTLIGVNSRVFHDDPYELGLTREEVEEFLDEINEAAPQLNLTLDDVGTVNRGLLPFGKNSDKATHLSFGKRSILIDHGSEGGPDGLITAMSVRLTMARLLAEQAIDLALEKLGGSEKPRSSTSHTPVAGGDVQRLDDLIYEISGLLPHGLPPQVATALAKNHGSHAGLIVDLIEARPDAARVLDGSTVLEAEVLYVARTEQVEHLADVVFRRTDLGTGECPSWQALERCSQLVGDTLGWSERRRQNEIRQVVETFPEWLRPQAMTPTRVREATG